MTEKRLAEMCHLTEAEQRCLSLDLLKASYKDMCAERANEAQTSQ